MTVELGAGDEIADKIERLRFAASVLMLHAWSAQDAASWMEILCLVRSRHPECDSISLHGEPVEICVWKHRRLIQVIDADDSLAGEIAASYDSVDDPSTSLGPEGHYRTADEIVDAFNRAIAAVQGPPPL